MYGPVKPRVALVANRSTSLNAIGGNTDAKGPINRHSSSDFNNGSPKTRERNTGNFGNSPQPNRYEVNPDMLVAARRSMDITKTSPKSSKRSLPPLPPLPEHAQSPATSPTSLSPPARASASPASSPHASHPLPPLPATPASPASSPHASQPLPLVPTTSASPVLNTQPPPSPTLAPALLSKSSPEILAKEPTSLSPSNSSNKLLPRRPLPATPSQRLESVQPRATTSPDLSKDPSDPSPRKSLPPPHSTHSETLQSPPEVDQQDKKDTKYYSNPEPAVTIKDGLCQRHLSAPSSVVSENELNANAESNETATQTESANWVKSDKLKLSRELSNPDIRLKSSAELTNPENKLRYSSEVTNENRLKSSSEISFESPSPSPSPSPRNSTEFSSDPTSPTQMRSWYLKKNSVQERIKPLPKERPEYRTHRKSLPDMVEATQKNKVIKEIFTTEAIYADDLYIAIKVFKEPLRRYKFVSEEDVSAMFSNIEELYEINKNLLASLVEIIPVVNELAADEAPCPPICDVFLRHLPKFSGYTTYLCNKDLSARVVKEVEHLDDFASLMKECRHNHESNGLGLGDYLIKPVQRLCKYPLLFKELKKYLLPEDPQLPLLDKVISEVEQLADISNKTISNVEKLGEIKKIMGNEISPLLEGATLIRSGSVFVVAKSKKEEAFFWLLDNLVVWHPMKSTLRKVVKSSKIRTTISIPSIVQVNEGEYERHKHSFSLKYTGSSGKEKKAVFCALSYLEKLCWIEDIKAQLPKL